MNFFLNKNLPVLDPEMLESLKSFDTQNGAFLNELIMIFANDSYPVLDRLIAAIESGEEIQSMRLAHKLKGMGQNLGTERLGHILERIEVEFPSLSTEVRLLLPELLRAELEAAVLALRRDWFRSSKAG